MPSFLTNHPLFCARTLTVLGGALMMQRVGHTGRLLQDLLCAVIFLIAIIAAPAYVLDLPVKGVLATSGAVAIIVGLALQSTLSDVFSGIVLNTTKPYQLDDWISIDGTEGRVTDIDWRATRLQTPAAKSAIICSLSNPEWYRWRSAAVAVNSKPGAWGRGR